MRPNIRSHQRISKWFSLCIMSHKSHRDGLNDRRITIILVAVTELIKNENILNSIDWIQRYHPAWTIVQINLAKRSNHYFRDVNIVLPGVYVEFAQSNHSNGKIIPASIYLTSYQQNFWQKRRIQIIQIWIQNPQSDFGKQLVLNYDSCWITPLVFFWSAGRMNC